MYFFDLLLGQDKTPSVVGSGPQVVHPGNKRRYDDNDDDDDDDDVSIRSLFRL